MIVERVASTRTRCRKRKEKRESEVKVWTKKFFSLLLSLLVKLELETFKLVVCAVKGANGDLKRSITAPGVANPDNLLLNKST